MLLAVMWACLRRCHCIAGTTVESMVEEHRRDAKLDRIELGENGLCIIGAIVVPHTGVIAPNNKMRATVVLAHQGMENRLTRTGIAHGCREHTKDDALHWIIVR